VNVPVTAKQAAQGGRNLPRRQDAGCDLIQKRLEQVVIGAVDQRDVDRRSGQRLCRA
jgi:hypothetical protein